MTKAEKTRKFIIEKAAPIFNKKGMAGTAISDIMEATKLAKGGVYGNFDSKEQICVEAFSYLLQSINAAIVQAMEDKTTAKEKLHALVEFYTHRLFNSNRGGCPILNFGTEADDTNPLIKQKVKEAIATAQGRISKLVYEGIVTGDFKKTFNAEIFAIKMFTMVEGAILISRTQGNNHQVKVIAEILNAEIEANSN
jgi:TetR/AcrR family transcriptional repressor of nem operon